MHFNIFLTASIVISIPIILHYLKKWFRGGVCKIKKDLNGKIIIITGANAGIGYETALQLAKLNATIILAGRSEERNKQAQEQIKKESGNNQIHFIKLDLCSFQSIKDFVTQFKDKFTQLDILINNAGLSSLIKSKTQDGLDITVGTNHYGHFLLTNLLLDIIKTTKQSRIINLSSLMHADIKNKKQFSLSTLSSNTEMEFFQYAKSKLANVLFTKELQKKFDPNQVKVVSVHPGAVKTEFMQKLTQQKLYFKIFSILIIPIVMLGFKSALEGAQTTLQCALEDFDKLQAGEYYSDCKVKKSSKLSYDEQLQKELWDHSLNIVGLK